MNIKRWKLTIRNITTKKYFTLQDFLESVLTSDQGAALKPHVLAAVSKPKYIGNSLADITKYVADHVKYAQDQPVPLPPSLEELKYGYYSPRTAPNVFLPPADTIEKGYGDCDDINTLLAAMVKVYFKMDTIMLSTLLWGLVGKVPATSLLWCLSRVVRL